MKQYLLAALLLLAAMPMWAQDTMSTAPAIKPDKTKSRRVPLYLGFSGGFNNPPGLFGFDMDVPVTDFLSVTAGAGLSTWGEKAHAGIRLYLSPRNRGFAFGSGVTYSTGKEHLHFFDDGDGGYNNREQINVYGGVYYYFTSGYRSSRGYVGLGWSQHLVPLLHYDYSNRAGTSAGDQAMADLFAPGGIMISIGRSFSLRKRQW